MNTSDRSNESLSYSQTAPNKRGYKLNFETIKRNLAILAIGAGVLFSSNFIHDNLFEYGDNPEDRGEKIKNATSILLEEDALLRKDAVVENVDGGNVVEQVKERTVVELKDGTYAHFDEENGTWYYLSKDDLASADIDISGKGVWVNEQRAEIVTDESVNKVTTDIVDKVQ